MRIGDFEGQVTESCRVPEFLQALAGLPRTLQSPSALLLQAGRNRHMRVCLPCGGTERDVIVKSFGKRSLPRDLIEAGRTGRAERSWRVAQHLRAAGVGTPQPLAWLARREGPRLVESHLITEFLDGYVSFTDELGRLFREDPLCSKFIALMQVVANAVRAMHASGVQHNDLGNQNILLRRTGQPGWDDVNFIDLNRARIRSGLTDRQKARDISRIYLPSDLLRVFREMYWDGVPSPEFLTWERRYRRAFARHTLTRRWRHPVRERRQGGAAPYPAERDMWIWDDRSAQAISVLRPEDRHRLYPRWRSVPIAAATLRMLPGCHGAYRALLQTAFAEPVDLRDRVGVSVDPRPGDWDRERRLLDELGPVPVRLRLYFHEDEALRGFRVRAARELHAAGRKVAVALVQSRRAVLVPREWDAFVERSLADVDAFAETVEVGHAVNRVKWGVWDIAEWRRLMEPAASARRAHPGPRIVGPSAIDFEYPFVAAGLLNLPDGLALDGLAHLLYVDRRGAPENGQGPFSALEKFALARALARASGRCEDRLIVAEVNWPIRGTGPYSPVTSPYESPGPRFGDPSVGEDLYADYMLRYLLIAACSGLVDRVYWWRLVARGFGLVDDSDPAAWRRRPAFHALRRFLTLLDGGRFDRLTREDRAAPAGATRVHRYGLRTGSGERVELVYAHPHPVEVALPEGCRRVENLFGEAQDVGERASLSGRPLYLRFPGGA